MRATALDAACRPASEPGALGAPNSPGIARRLTLAAARAGMLVGQLGWLGGAAGGRTGRRVGGSLRGYWPSTPAWVRTSDRADAARSWCWAALVTGPAGSGCPAAALGLAAVAGSPAGLVPAARLARCILVPHATRRAGRTGRANPHHPPPAQPAPHPAPARRRPSARATPAEASTTRKYFGQR